MRDESISIAKGIAILLMVLAHTYFSQYGNLWINMFHMPLFFFFAGYCFKDKYIKQPKIFLQKRIIGLYKPFVKWSIVFLLLHNVFFYLNIYSGDFGFKGNVSHIYTWKDFVIRLFYILTRMSDCEQLLGGYWFLKSLFVGSILGYFTITKVKSFKIGGGILLCLTIGLVWLHKSVPYFGIGAKEFFSAEFFVIGYYYKTFGCKLHEKWYVLPIGIMLVTMGVQFYQATLLKFEWWQVIPYLITSITGLLAVFYLSKIIASHDSFCKVLLVYTGSNTLPILTWHMLSFKIVSLLIINVYGLPMERLAEFPVIEEYSRQGWFILYFIVGTIVPLLMTKSKYLK